MIFGGKVLEETFEDLSLRAVLFAPSSLRRHPPSAPVPGQRLKAPAKRWLSTIDSGHPIPVGSGRDSLAGPAEQIVGDA